MQFNLLKKYIINQIIYIDLKQGIYVITVKIFNLKTFVFLIIKLIPTNYLHYQEIQLFKLLIKNCFFKLIKKILKREILVLNQKEMSHGKFV